MTLNIELAELDLPDFGLPTYEPVIPPETFQNRINALRERAKARGYEAFIVYGDREHCANLAYLTNFDPRFEEALLIITQNETPTLLVGNEGMAYTAICPIPLNKVLYQAFSLISQPRDAIQPLKRIFIEEGLLSDMRIGVAGWKYFTASESPNYKQWLEIPAYIVDTLRELGCEVENATDLFMHPTQGLRAVNEVDQLALFEFSATHGSDGMKNLLFNVRPSLTEYEAVELLNYNGIPTNLHPMVLSGQRGRLGLASPSMRRLKIGDPIVAAFGLWGSNVARAGFLVHNVSELPGNVRNYVGKLVMPYFEAAVAWYETIGIGVTGGELYDAVHQIIGDPFFGVTLNPGHLVHLDEWLSSPVYKGSTEALMSGMAWQIDIIPATGTNYFTTNIEDTLALADEALREEFAAKYPEAWGRIQARRDFMQEVLGIHLKPEVLPFSNIPAYLPPFWLSPHKAMRVAR